MPPSVISGDLRHAGGRVEVMGGSEDATTRGIYLQSINDPSWVLYVASSSNGTSPSGSNDIPPPAPFIEDDASNDPSAALCGRLRISSDTDAGFIIENDTNESLFGIRGAGGSAYFTSDIHVASNVTIGGLLIPTESPVSSYYVGNESSDDFSNLQDAVDALSLNTKRARDGPENIILREDYAIDRSLVFSNGDYSHIEISSETDGSVINVDSGAYMSTEGSVIRVKNARGPVIRFQIDADKTGGHGVEVSGPGSTLSFRSPSSSEGSYACGVKNAQEDGLVIRDGARVFVEGSVDFSEADLRGLRVTSGGALIVAEDGSFKANDCGTGGPQQGVLFDNAGERCVLGGSNSTVEGYLGEGDIITAIRSSVSLDGLHISMSNVTNENTPLRSAIFADNSSSVSLSNVTIYGGSNVEVAVISQNLSSIDLTGSKLFGWTQSALETRKGGWAQASSVHTDPDGDEPLVEGDTNAQTFNTITSNGVIFAD